MASGQQSTYQCRRPVPSLIQGDPVRPEAAEPWGASTEPELRSPACNERPQRRRARHGGEPTHPNQRPLLTTATEAPRTATKAQPGQ